VPEVKLAEEASVADNAKPTQDEKDGGPGSGEIGRSVSFDLPGGQKMLMKYCPGGKFIMGSPAGEPGRQEDEAQVEAGVSGRDEDGVFLQGVDRPTSKIWKFCGQEFHIWGLGRQDPR
jgi:hypothetical protein